MLAGKRRLISGAVNRESISWEVTERALSERAQAELSAFPREVELTRAAAASQ